MSNYNHTPGPWKFRTGDADNYFEVLGPYKSQKTICLLPNGCFVPETEAEANARLIAAAPDLLDACQSVLESLKQMKQDSMIEGMIMALEIAIKKNTTIVNYFTPLNTYQMNKLFYQQDNIGRAKYTISYHDGIQTHNDGSPFYCMRIFSNKKELNKFRTELLKQGYSEK